MLDLVLPDSKNTKKSLETFFSIFLLSSSFSQAKEKKKIWYSLYDQSKISDEIKLFFALMSSAVVDLVVYPMTIMTNVSCILVLRYFCLL